MKKALIVMLLTLIMPMRVNASGFPVVDIAALVQALQDYLHQGMQYIEQAQTASENVVQTSTQIQQLNQMIQDWNQTLTEYNHLRNMIKSLKDTISEGDYIALMSMIDIYAPEDPFSADWQVGLYTDAGYLDVDDRVSRIYNRISDTATVFGELASTGLTGSELTEQQAVAERYYQRSRLSTAQQYAVEQNRIETAQLIQQNADMNADLIEVLRQPENGLQVQQIMALQNQNIISNLQKSQEIQNQILANSNQLSSELFANQSKAYGDEIKRLVDAQANGAGTYTPTNRGYSVNW